MLTREQRDRWAAALRSGEYKQFVLGAMEGDGAYCCLGVLCLLEGLPFNNYVTIDRLIGRLNEEAFVVFNDDDRLTFPEIADKVDLLPVLSDASQGQP